MLELLAQKKRVVVIDETWLNESSYVRKTWAPRDGTGNIVLRTISPRISMIAALDTDGRAWFSLSHANSNSDMMVLFLQHLTQALDSETPGWQEDTCLLWDGAKYHGSEQTRAAVRSLGIKLIQSGPYSYSAASIEMLFSVLKLGELNPEHKPTTKR